ncbi:LysR substrate-binding domain-containing protein [Microbacterium elymi]|uniref:LysR substrate-binding domain-containing protein n=1 Tax=Microbacterium elymi TaxID=2909587 RepID=A0ABY5NNC4_9MICO|nr:LysR substrate-binding domain-containing protein [Microbacterium elymi]UUT36687.1 LysR substrate-binding domain-containing protein [Microbacterium elymi]
MPRSGCSRSFLAVAEELNFSRAAERLHIAQPSLSAQIRHLEKELGVQLLERTTRTVSLTEAGQTLFERGPAALVGIQQMWTAVREIGQGVVGALRLAYPLSAGFDTVPRLVQAMHEAYPRIAITTEVAPSPTVLRAVRDGRADAGIARSPAPLDGVQLSPLRHDKLGVLVAADHPLATRTAIELADVADHPVVLHPRDANPAHHDLIVDLFAAHGVQPRLVERDIAFDLSQSFIIGGSASTIIGRSSAPAIRDSMRWIPLVGGEAETVALVLPPAERTAAARRFEQIALAYASEHGWLE